MNRLAQIGIIVQDISLAETVNDILHGYADYIVGRMGLPYKKYSVMVISIIIDAPADKINALAGKLAMLKGVNAKTIYANIGEHNI